MWYLRRPTIRSGHMNYQFILYNTLSQCKVNSVTQSISVFDYQNTNRSAFHFTGQCWFVGYSCIYVACSIFGDFPASLIFYVNSLSNIYIIHTFSVPFSDLVNSILRKYTLTSGADLIRTLHTHNLAYIDILKLIRKLSCFL